MLLLANPTEHAAKVGSPEKQHQSLHVWLQTQASAKKQTEFLVKTYMERLNTAPDVVTVPKHQQEDINGWDGLVDSDDEGVEAIV